MTVVDRGSNRTLIARRLESFATVLWMSQSSAQAAAFFAEVLETGILWTVRDDNGFPAPLNSDGERAQPFWSSEARVCRIISSVAGYARLQAEQLNVASWHERWLPGLQRDGILVGLNWTGDRATGFDLTAADVLARLDAASASHRP